MSETVVSREAITCAGGEGPGLLTPGHLDRRSGLTRPTSQAWRVPRVSACPPQLDLTADCTSETFTAELGGMQMTVVHTCTA
jgi:hypothetical protein